MIGNVEDYSLVETNSFIVQENQGDRTLSETQLLTNLPQKISKLEIRSSLRASTCDVVFSSFFTNATSGVLLSKFLLELGAGPVEIGMLSSIPMMVNLLQPLGAYLAERMRSRYWYSLLVFSPSRLLWLALVPAIASANSWDTSGYQLVQWTLAIAWVSCCLQALGSASWLSWMAVLVPRQLRGRYFGLRSSAANLVNLISVPLLSLAVSAWPDGTLAGYGVVLVLGVVMGLISLGCQFFMRDVNPQQLQVRDSEPTQSSLSWRDFSFLKEANFLRFLLYLALWMFAVNVSAPFFNLYMLNDLAIDVRVVTLYCSLTAGANLLMLVFWGKLADRIGNRPLLITVGVLVALTPLLWLGAGNNAISLWLWLPLLHLLAGGTWAAIDLCNNNLQMGVVPLRNQSSYFAIAAAVAGVSGALGITAGSFLATLAGTGGILQLFVLSAVLRLAALLPLVYVQEPRSVPLRQLIDGCFPLHKPYSKLIT
ncbi:MAG: MFS transporter, partial [Coleofasciculus sp. S288]|nr:MFS transporter [Coleofasciculus sp. S288]